MQTLSRYLAAVECAVVTLVAVALAILAMWGLLGIDSTSGLLHEGLMVAVLVGLFACVDLLYRYVRAGGTMRLDLAWSRLPIAAGGTLLATALTAYRYVRLSDNDAYVEGYSFLEAACVAWIPIAHMGGIAWLGGRANNRIERTRDR